MVLWFRQYFFFFIGTRCIHEAHVGAGQRYTSLSRQDDKTSLTSSFGLSVTNAISALKVTVRDATACRSLYCCSVSTQKSRNPGTRLMTSRVLRYYGRQFRAVELPPLPVRFFYNRNITEKLKIAVCVCVCVCVCHSVCLSHQCGFRMPLFLFCGPLPIILYQRFSVGRCIYADYKTDIIFAVVQGTLLW